MDLWIVAIALFGLSALLLIVSFFKKEEDTNSNEEVEDVSLDIYEHIYYLKRRVATLENQLEVIPTEGPYSERITSLTEKHILTLFTRGESAESISERLRISEPSVQHIIDTYISEGIN